MDLPMMTQPENARVCSRYLAIDLKIGRLVKWKIRSFMYFVLLIMLVSWLIPREAEGTVYLEKHLEAEHIVDIAKDWEWFPYELISPDSKKTSDIVLPVNTKFYTTSVMKYSADGYASFRKILDIGKYRGILTFKLPYCLHACQLFINSERVYTSGEISVTPNPEARGKAGFQILNYQPKSDRLVLVMHSSSYARSYGGMIRGFEVSSLEASRKFMRYQTIVDATLIGVATTMGLYHFILFGIRRRNRAALVFGLICLANTFRAFTAGGSQIMFQYLDISTAFAFRYEYICFYIAFYYIWALLNELFPQETPKITNIIGMNVLLLCILLTLFVPLPYASIILRFVQFKAVMFYFLTIYIVIKAINNKNTGAKLTLAGFLIYCLFAFADMYMSFSSYQYNLSNIGISIFIMFQSTALSVRFTEAFRTVENNEVTIHELNQELTSHVKNLDIKVKNRTQALNYLMDNTQAGICVIGKDLKIGSLYSKHLTKILGRSDLAGHQFTQVLEKANLSKDEKSVISSVLDMCIGQDELNFAVNQPSLPRELVMKHHGDERIVSIDWSPIITDKLISQIIVTMNDITENRQVQLDNATKDMSLKAIGQLLSLGQKRYRLFLAQLLELVKTINIGSTLDKEQFHNTYLGIHTLKGNARTYDFGEIANALHSIESQLMTRLRNNLPIDLSLVNIDALKEAILDLRSVADDRLKWNTHDQAAYLIPEYLLQKLKSETTAIGNYSLTKGIESILNQVEFVSSLWLFQDIMNESSNIAKFLDKPSPSLHLDVPSFWLSIEQERALRDAFIHILRNSMDHGIESPQERLSKQKSEQGHLFLKVSIADDQVIAEFRDDGRGINTESIGNLTGQMEEDNQRLSEILFRPGFTTKEVASHMSGRGIGMDAIKVFLASIGGTVEIQFQKKSGEWRGFTTRLHFPLLQANIHTQEDIKDAG